MGILGGGGSPLPLFSSETTKPADLYQFTLSSFFNDYSFVLGGVEETQEEDLLSGILPTLPHVLPPPPSTKEAVKGSPGPDIISGGSANDTIFGLGGDDFLYGDFGDDYLVGGRGDDILDGAHGGDILIGGPGFDFASYALEPFRGVEISLRSGTAKHVDGSVDTLRKIEGILGSAFSDLIAGDNRADALLGHHGDDSLSGYGGADFVNGGNGNDTISGGSGNDFLIGDLEGELGIDSISGDAGNDFLIGGFGDDKLFGGAGKDVLDGGLGDDSLDGGKGRDAASYLFANGPVSVGLWIEGRQDTGAAGLDVLNGIEDLIGSAFNDWLEGDGGRNVLVGYDGNDILDGSTGKDVLVGGLGDDTYMVDNPRDRIFESDNQGIDQVESMGSYKLPGHVEILILNGTDDGKAIGNKSNNLLIGNAANNKIVGGKGGDVLIGGDGRDVLIGGPGADIFVFDDPSFSGVGKSERDVIKGFKAAQGDLIDFTSIDANGNPADGHQVFEFIGSDHFANAPGGPRPGLIRFEKQLLEADLNGDGIADMACALPKVKDLDVDALLL